MGEVAQQVGYVPLQDLENIKKSVLAMCVQYKADMAELEGYRNVFANLREYGIGVPDISISESDLSNASEVLSEIGSILAKPSAGTDQGSDESSSGEGSGDVPVSTTHKGKRSF